jgi:hypothetical protein
MAARKSSSGRKYGKAASKSVETAMRRRNLGTLKSGAGRHPKVTSRAQAIAIGLSEAREKGAKVPPLRKTTAKKSSTKKAAAKKSTAKRSTAKKTSTKRTSAKKSSPRKTTGKRSTSKRSR